MLEEWGAADQEAGVEPVGVRGSEWRSETETVEMCVCVCVRACCGRATQIQRGWGLQAIPSSQAVHLEGASGFSPLQSAFVTITEVPKHHQL